MRQLFRDPVLQSRFEVDGYVQLPMLSADEVAQLRTAVERLRPDDGFAPEPGNGRKRSYHCTFLDTNRSYRRQTFDLLSAAFAPHVERVLSGYALLQCNFYVKPPGRGAFNTHLNWPQLADLNDTSVSLWCPLSDTSEENGGLGLVPGSHKILPHVQGPTTPAYFRDIQQQVADSGLFRTLAVRAGEAVIFDDSLIHGSPENSSSEARIAIQLICRPVDAAAAYWRAVGDDLFERVEAEPEFWLTNDVGDLLLRPARWRSLGYVRSQNRFVTFAELRQLLDRGETIRRAGFEIEPAAPPAPPSPLRRVASAGRRLFRGTAAGR